MEGKTQFTITETPTDSAEFKLVTELPADLEGLADISSNMRKTMSPEMRRMLELTDVMALRSAALPQSQ